MSTHVAAHRDAYFSMWRLGWIAHALRTDPRTLFDGNIFYPTRNTLAYSDAMLLEGVIAAPLLWSGVSPFLTYNLLLIGRHRRVRASGCSCWSAGSPAAAPARFLAAAVFTMAPYRIEHFMHLELQWTMWMPLTFWAVHRTIRLAVMAKRRSCRRVPLAADHLLRLLRGVPGDRDRRRSAS